MRKQSITVIVLAYLLVDCAAVLAQPVVVSLCDIARDPRSVANREIAVLAEVDTNGRSLFFKDASCPQLTVDGFKWRNDVMLVDTFMPRAAYPALVAFVSDRESLWAIPITAANTRRQRFLLLVSGVLQLPQSYVLPPGAKGPVGIGDNQAYYAYFVYRRVLSHVRISCAAEEP